MMEPVLAHSEVKLNQSLLFIATAVVAVLATMAAASVANPLDGVIVRGAFWALVYGVGAYTSSKLAISSKLEKFSEDFSKGCAVLGLLVFFYYIFDEGAASALLVMLMWLQAAIFFQLKTSREVYIALMISFVLILFSATLTRSSFFIVYLIAYTLLAFCVLSVLYSFSAEIGAQSLSAQGINQEQKLSKLPWHLISLSLLILFMAFFVYLLTPRFQPMDINGVIDANGHSYENSDWEKEARNPDSGSGADNKNEKPFDQIDDTETSDIEKTLEGKKERREALRQQFENQWKETLQDNQYEPRSYEQDAVFSDEVFINKESDTGVVQNDIVMYMHAVEPIYLRGRSYDTFTGYSWINSDLTTRKRLLKFGSYEFQEAEPEATRSLVIEVAANLKDIIFTPNNKTSIDFPGTVIAEGVDGSIYAPRDLKEGTSYKVSYLPDAYEGRTAIRLWEEPESAYLDLPEDFDESIRTLALEVTEDAADAFEKANALESHLRADYEYDLDSVFTSQGVTPLSKFLFETKRGHCEYFASSMAIMLRSIGIPSRLISGYSATQYNPITGYFEVRRLHGHAWVEAFIKGVGWVTFEPTPAYSLPEPEGLKTASEEIKDYLENLVESARSNDVESPEVDLAEGLLSVFKTTELLIKRIFYALMSGLSLIVLFLQNNAFVLIGGAILLIIVYWFRAYFIEAVDLARIKALRADAEDAPAKMFVLFERWFERRGLGREAAEDLSHYRGRLVPVFPSMEKDISGVLFILGRAFYDEVELAPKEIKKSLELFGAMVDETKFRFRESEAASAVVPV